MKIKISFFGRQRGAKGYFFGQSEVIEIEESRKEIWENVIEEFLKESGGDVWNQPEFKPIMEKWEIQGIRKIDFEKIKVTKITFPFSESGVDYLNREFLTWGDAERALASVNPPDLGYYKTDFCIEFEDGEIYKGRFDIGSDAPTLKDHILGFAERISKGKNPPELKKEYANFIRDYQIG